MSLKVYVPDMPKAAELLVYLERIDATGQYTNFGPLEREFVARIAEWIDLSDPPPVVTFSSGTDALTAALRSLRLLPGARVLTPSLTFPATVFAIQAAGLQPVLADVDPHEWRLTPEIASGSLGAIEAVVPVAAFGAPLSVCEWDEFALTTGTPVVIDAAGALLQRLRPRHCSAVFSLHATKPFGVGEGGLLVAPDPLVAEYAQRLSNFGFHQGQVLTPSGNGKMSEYHAAVGLAQLDRISQVKARLCKVLSAYDELLPVMGRQEGLPANLVVYAPGGAKALAEALARAGVETRRWYQPDISSQAAFADLPRAGPLETCEALRDHLLGLPFHTRLTRSDVELVAGLVRRAVEAECPPALKVGCP